MTDDCHSEHSPTHAKPSHHRTERAHTCDPKLEARDDKEEAAERCSHADVHAIARQLPHSRQPLPQLAVTRSLVVPVDWSIPAF